MPSELLRQEIILNRSIIILVLLICGLKELYFTIWYIGKYPTFVDGNYSNDTILKNIH